MHQTTCGEYGITRSNIDQASIYKERKLERFTLGPECRPDLNRNEFDSHSELLDISFNDAWFLSFRVFGLLSSSLLLFLQRFSRYVPRASLGVCRTREPARNFEQGPVLNPRGSSVLIPLAIIEYKC